MPLTLIKRSLFTGKVNTMVIRLDPAVFDASLKAMEAGLLVQDAFPTLTSEEREFIKTGVTPQEWAEFIGPEED